MLTQQIMQKSMVIQSSYDRATGPIGARPQRSDKVPKEFRILSTEGQKKKTARKRKKKRSVPAMRPAKKMKSVDK